MALNSNFRTLTADNMEGVVSTRNYLKNSFENGSLTGWTELSVALTSGLPTGTPTISATAASSLTLSVTSTTPLSLDKSLLVSVPSALTAGQGFISDAFTLDRMDLGKVITVSFDYERISGTYNFSGTLGSQTWMVYVYDATAGGANWIQPAGFLGMNQSSSAGRVACTFQSSVVAGQQYRIAVIASQAAAGASSIEFDNFSCSRQTAPIGPVVTDWVDRGAITITGSTSNPTKGATSVDKMWTRRVGDNLEVRVEYVQSATGTAGSGDYLLSLPAGFSIDTSKLTVDTAIEGGSSDYTLNNSVGSANLGVSTTNLVGTVCVYDATKVRIFGLDSSGSGSNRGAWGSSYFALSSANMFLTASFSVPISGWSSNVQLSNDTDTRVVALRATTSTAKTLSAPYTSPTVAVYETVEFDTHGAYSPSTGIYKVPVSGYYKMTIHFVTNSIALPAGASAGCWVKKNGANYSVFATARTPTALTGPYEAGGSTIVLCNAGDEIAPALYSDVAGTTQISAQFNHLSIERLSGPSVVAASETVACSYTSGGGQVNVPNNAITPCTVYTSKLYDTHNSFSGGGTFTAPISGIYEVKASIQFGINGTGNRNLYAISSTETFILGALQAFSGNYTQPQGTCLMRLNAGQSVSIRAYQSSGGLLANSVDAAGTFISVVRVGNY